MTDYMIFNPLGLPPWEMPPIKKRKLVYNITNFTFISNAYVKLKDKTNYGLQFSNRIINIVSPRFKNYYNVSILN